MAALAVTGYAASAQAQDTGQVYVNAGVNVINGEDATVTSLSGRFGYTFAKYFGIEGEAGFGIIDDDDDGIELDLDSSFAVFGVLTYPMNDQWELLARVGYNKSKFNVSDIDGSDKIKTDGLAAGVGIQYMRDDLNGIRGDYTYFEFKPENDDYEDDDANVFSLSYVRKF